jgi:hypothetical protein
MPRDTLIEPTDDEVAIAVLMSCTALRSPR